MGDIDIPAANSVIYHDTIGGWMTEEEWISRFNMKYKDPKYIKFYQESPDIHFVAFFTTTTQDHPKSWKHIMRVAAKIKRIAGIPGEYIEVTNLARFGITDDKVKNMDYIKEKYYNKDEMKLLISYQVPMVFLGDIRNYIHMLGSLSHKMKGRGNI